MHLVVGLRITRGITRIMGGLGFLVDGWERWCPLLRYRTGAGEIVGLGTIAGRIVKRIIICRCWELRGWREGELMVRIKSLGYGGGVEGRAVVGEKEGVRQAIRAEA